MPSHARHAWDHDFATRLDQLVRIHADARGRGPGRRWYTETLNQSLFVFLVAQFQAYCRALHVEASEAALTLADPRLSEVLRRLLELGRKLDRSTPRPSVLGNDFALLGINLLPALKAHRPRLLKDLERLDLLIDFRNAASHGNQGALNQLAATGMASATLESFRKHRASVNRLVVTMDEVVAIELSARLHIPRPW